jgi:hypothetical protein
LYCYCTVIYCYCTVIVLLLYCYCTVIVLLFYCYCIVILLLFYCYCTAIVLILYCYCIVIVLLLYCYCTVIVLSLYCYCTVIVLLLYCLLYSCCSIHLLFIPDDAINLAQSILVSKHVLLNVPLQLMWTAVTSLYCLSWTHIVFISQNFKQFQGILKEDIALSYILFVS